MTTTFEMNGSELDSHFLQAIKTLFKNRQIRLTIDTEMDETDFLLNNPENKKRLLQSVTNIENGDNLIEISITDLKNLADA